jgi:hypothetical protein
MFLTSNSSAAYHFFFQYVDRIYEVSRNIIQHSHLLPIMLCGAISRGYFDVLPIMLSAVGTEHWQESI